jgi:hypothetical protein
MLKDVKTQPKGFWDDKVIKRRKTNRIKGNNLNITFYGCNGIKKGVN